MALLVGMACAAVGSTAAGDMVGTTARPDGSRVHWTLSNAVQDRANRIVFVAQGSGCAPARASSSVRMLAEILSDYAVLTIEKYGVAPDDAPADPMADCSGAYLENHTVSQRVADARAVFEDLRARGLLDGDLVLFGGSEGGAVVSLLSHQAEDADAVVVFSTGTGLTMAEFFPLVVPPPVAERMQAVFDEIRNDPSAQGVLSGVSYDWWRDSLDRRYSDDLLTSNVPVLIVQGADDRSAPVEAARAARDAFMAAGQERRLTYWEFEDRDHGMVDAQGVSHMGAVLKKVRDWIEAQMPPDAG